MAFINIAFQAEVSRFEDAEFEEIAKRNCNENPATRQQIIEDFRKMIYGEFHHYRKSKKEPTGGTSMRDVLSRLSR